MLELLSYGEYDQLFISVICFLKRTRLPFHRFQFFIYFLSFRKTSTYIIFLLLNNNDHSDSVLKRWIIYTWINFSLGYPCCEINFWRTKDLKIAWSFCAKVFKDHLNQAICYLASFKASTSKIITWNFFFDSTKWLKAYETGYPIFINNFLKPERVVCSKCQHCSSIKMTLLKLPKSEIEIKSDGK